MSTSSVDTLLHAFRRFRRGLKDKLPYVRRRQFRRLQAKYDHLTEALGMGVPRADEVGIHALKAVVPGDAAELCLFLSHHPGPSLKPHVAAHLGQLLDRGVRVVLILNSPRPASDVRIDPLLAARLDGIYVRDNLGYDFAGWAHVHSLISKQLKTDRLYLVNDSIVGPLDGAAFDGVLARIRQSPADFIGLTEARSPRPHLQSFFLVFNRRTIDEALTPFFREVLCFAEKGTVIDVYETRLTQRLQQAGFTWEPVFPTLTPHDIASNDTYFLWEELLRNGFPYLKASVLAENRDHPTVRKLVTREFLAQG